MGTKLKRPAKAACPAMGAASGLFEGDVVKQASNIIAYYILNKNYCKSTPVNRGIPEAVKSVPG
jgi:hypothetical protein